MVPVSARESPLLTPVKTKTLKYYKCNYCGRVLLSASEGQAGRVRIRCPCGGKHRDGVSRMHAHWTAIEARTNPDSESQPEPAAKRQRHLSPVVRLQFTDFRIHFAVNDDSDSRVDAADGLPLTCEIAQCNCGSDEECQRRISTWHRS